MMNGVMRTNGALLCLLLGAVGCAQLQPRPELPNEVVTALATNSRLDGAFSALESQHPGESGFHLISEGTEAFFARVQSGRMAARSLDVQTYIWHSDLTGVFMAQQLLESADRGVKVRLLVDDMDARSKNDGFAALAAHPNIEVRMFNPFASRSGKLGMLSEGLRNAGRINRRMHNKSWIADNRLALVGGRNVGDEYYGAGDEVNFVDLDIAMVGPVVRDVSASFDRFWNSLSAYPIELLDPESVSVVQLDQLRVQVTEHATAAKDSRYAMVLHEDDAVNRLVAGDWPLQWTRAYRFVSDDPNKVTMTKRDAQRAAVGASLVPVITGAKADLRIISPYFVPGKQVTAALIAASKAGRNVSVLTNSLAANDVAAVHGGYSRYRKALLAGGVQIWELKPLSGGDTTSSSFGSSGASLHTKALSADGVTLFVGSFNIDPRSAWLNSEQGVLLDSVVLAKQFGLIFDVQTLGERAWKVTLEAKRLRWTDGAEVFDSEPKAGVSRRMQAWLARTLHLDAQL